MKHDLYPATISDGVVPSGCNASGHDNHRSEAITMNTIKWTYDLDLEEIIKFVVPHAGHYASDSTPPTELPAPNSSSTKNMNKHPSASPTC